MNGSTFYLILCVLGFVLQGVALFGLFKKAGEDGWKGFVPVLNRLTWLKITGRPVWWLAMLFIPVVNFVFIVGMSLDLVKSFNKHKFWQHALAVLLPFVYFPIIAFNPKDKYLGPWAVASRLIMNSELKTQITRATGDEKAKLQKKLKPLTDREKEVAKAYDLSVKGLRRNLDMPQRSELREWLDAILFAGTVALLIRALVIEAFMIPTSSMEGSLLAGDFLFVSKVHYGIRLPQAPLSIPFIHNKIPGTNAKSFIDGVQLPYTRLPGFREVQRNDIVVFNYPGDDKLKDVGSPGQIKITSMKQNYIKRCVGVPGDKLEMKRGELFVNDAKGWDAEHQQTTYGVASGVILNPQTMVEVYGFRTDDNNINKNFRIYKNDPTHGDGEMNPATAQQLRNSGMTVEKLLRDPFKNSLLDSVQHQLLDSARLADFNRFQLDSLVTMLAYTKNEMAHLYPNRYDYVDENGEFIDGDRRTRQEALNLKLKVEWNIDNFGPIVIPKKGMTIPLNEENFNMYHRPITGYEGHTLEKQGNTYLLDGNVATEYTFEMDYYWLMGDNRHASLDSRFWGFVPEDHVIGRPWAVLISWEGGPRFDRFLSPVTRWEP